MINRLCFSFNMCQLYFYFMVVYFHIFFHISLVCGDFVNLIKIYHEINLLNHHFEYHQLHLAPNQLINYMVPIIHHVFLQKNNERNHHLIYLDFYHLLIHSVLHNIDHILHHVMAVLPNHMILLILHAP